MLTWRRNEVLSSVESFVFKKLFSEVRAWHFVQGGFGSVCVQAGEVLFVLLFSFFISFSVWVDFMT